jgi:hypothetical protein
MTSNFELPNTVCLFFVSRLAMSLARLGRLVAVARGTTAMLFFFLEVKLNILQ